jgi:hypothetical protein
MRRTIAGRGLMMLLMIEKQYRIPATSDDVQYQT